MNRSALSCSIPTRRSFGRRPPERTSVRLESTVGTIDIEVVRRWAPREADRFVALVHQGCFDGARFFRVRPGRWVQFGINGDPAIAKAWRTGRSRTIRLCSQTRAAPWPSPSRCRMAGRHKCL